MILGHYLYISVVDLVDTAACRRNTFVVSESLTIIFFTGQRI